MLVFDHLLLLQPIRCLDLIIAVISCCNVHIHIYIYYNIPEMCFYFLYGLRPL